MAEALVALGRMSSFLTAEELDDPYLLDANLGPAVLIDADFSWESVKPASTTTPESESTENEKAKDGEKVKKSKKAKSDKIEEEKEEVENAEEVAQDPPFTMSNIKMTIPRGAFIAIVGRVGSGKVCRLPRRFPLLIASSELYLAGRSWRDATDQRIGGGRWIHRIFSSDSLDQECNSP